jgi:hypothetical protein
MTPLTRSALATLPWSAEEVEKLYAIARARSLILPDLVTRLCASHERLRIENQGLEQLLKEAEDVKASKAVLEAVQKMQAEGRLSSDTRVNTALLGPPTLDVVPGETEAQFQTRFVAYARAKGWARIAHFRRVRVQRKDGSTYWETPVAEDGAGFLDLELVRERLIKVELKVSTDLRPDQKEWLEAYRRAGVEAHVFYPKDFALIEKVLA